MSAMLPVVAVFALLVCITRSSTGLPFEQKGFWDFGKEFDVQDLLMMMKDEEDGSAFGEVDPQEQPGCPFGCQCSLRVVQCSDQSEQNQDRVQNPTQTEKLHLITLIWF